MEYKEGIWYGWNGGERPVHPKTVVECVYSSTCQSGAEFEEGLSEQFDWEHDGSFNIVAFRVIKEYKEPREFWISGNDGVALKTLEAAEWDFEMYGEPFIHVREVLEDE